MQTNTSYLSNLTPLRGIAALLTVIFHVDLMFGGGGDMLLKFKDSMLINKCYLMVDFFFVLSGFIMCHVYGPWFQNRVTGVDFKRFAVARFARVYPLHVVTLAYLVAARLIFLSAGRADSSPFGAASFTWGSIPTNLLLIQSMNVHNWFSWNNAAWSISTEWWMYMLFPFLVVPFVRLPSWGRFAVVLGCFAGYLSIMFYFLPLVELPDSLSFIKNSGGFTSQPTINVAYQFGFLRCFFGFVIGMALYQGYRSGFARQWLGSGYALAFFALGLGLCLHFAVPDVFTVGFFPLILLSAAYGSPAVNALFGVRPLQRLGDWSFSIYMVHQPIMFTIGFVMDYLNPPAARVAHAGPPPKPDMLTGWIICLVFIAFTLFVSFLTYRFIEVPARRWINGRPVAPTAEPVLAPT